ncbi:NERD domain-containing protein [Paenibacillus terrae]|uniref:NERD domain-containing protein n=1 Tax=Paenibacillus terrae TaxID=159743 RepID=A0A0D7X1S8_9BACL|nr:NERD domain-containing protein [Paenibacillus terrae]KJD43997.1 hypothetical protein QD47_19520 [Paenibacillus terrae]
MAKLKSIRHMLRNEVHWNPFSDNYDREKIKQDLNKYKEAVKTSDGESDLDDQYALTIAAKGPLFHSIFKQVYDYMRDAIEETKAHPEHIMKFLVAIGNSDTIRLNKDMAECLSQSDPIRLEDMENIQIDSGEGRPKLNAVGAFEMQVDLLNTLLNYLRYFMDKKGLHDHYDMNQLVNISSYLYASSNMFFTVKDSYDRITWEDGRIKEFSEDELHLMFKNEQYLKLQKVGQFRVEKNVFAATVESFRFTDNSVLRGTLNSMRKKAYLKEVSVDHRGFVSIQISKTDDFPLNEEMLIGLSAIVSFYPHIDLEPLKGLQRLTIRDVILLYSALLTLAKALRDHLSQIEKVDYTELKRLFIRIKKKELLSYLQKVTTFSKSQIESFLSIIENDLYNMNKKKRINLWARPLVKSREVYFLLLASLQAPNYLQLIDEWLESANYSLDARGFALEKFLKEELQSYLKDKGKYAVIPNKQKFYASKREFEEIDLIVSMEKMILIAEVKNIKYPMEARDYHNGYKRLKQGAEQIKRKRDYLLRHSSVFDSELRGIEGKSIHAVVICNYPHFTGMEIDGVSVIDYMALQSYFDKGEIKKMKVFFEGENQQSKVLEKNSMWNNMNEFYERFESYLKLPTVVKNLLELIRIKESRITLEEATVQMSMQVAVINNAQSID